MPIARYRIAPETVGTGGFGKVRRGLDTVLDRTIAMKTLDPLLRDAQSTDIERFKREAQSLAKLNHPNIPAIYDVIVTENEFHIIFQYIEGKTIRQLLSEGPLSLSEVRAWFDQIGSALEHAHKHQLIHRDIKPENMIVTADRKHSYLVDFGIAISRDDRQRLTASGAVVGTPGYMSPEHENGEDLDESDDVYVLGVCLYEALSGHRMAPGKYVELSTQNEAIPPAIDKLIQSCVADKPIRLQSASAFRDRLEAALQLHAPLSTILTEGQLHDVLGAVREMTAEDFMKLPAGQRKLILSKCRDVVVAKDDRLIPARSEFLRVLTTRAIYVDTEAYREILDPAIHYGFDLKQTRESDWIGDRRIREALQDAAVVVNPENHKVFSDTLLGWLKDIDVSSRDNWFYHALRKIVQRLMANTSCKEETAGDLDAVLNKVNELQREAD